MFLRAGPRAPVPLSSHSLSRRQPRPTRPPHRRAIAETKVHRPRAPRSVGTPPAGRSQAPRHPTPRGISTAGPPLSDVPRHPLKRSHRSPADFLLPRVPFVSPSMPERRTRFPHCPGICLAGFPPPEPLLRAGLHPSVTTIRPPSGERPPSYTFPQSTAASSPR
jgi:hypothetical protein